MMRTLALMTVLCLGACSDSSSPDPDSGTDSSVDSGADSGADAATDAPVCDPVECRIDCEFGFVVGADGCEVCECNPPPDMVCADADECVIARDVSQCCSCEGAFTRSHVDALRCLVARGESIPSGCVPGPEECGDVLCEACDLTLDVDCVSDACVSLSECPEGRVQFGLDCVEACAAHTDCTIAADYGICCGGCGPAPTSFVEANACWASRQSESLCAPAPGACDDLGCASPPSDCLEGFVSAVCMEDGSCADGGPAGMCPSGFTDVDGVCVAD